MGFALLILVFLLRLPTLHIPFENDSGAIAYHARYISQGDPLYGTHHPSHHMPGAFYLYAWAFTWFGDQVVSVKWVLLIWIWVTVCLIYWLGVIIANHWVGMVAAILSAVLYSHLELAGHSTRIEMFLGLFHVTAVLILLHTLPRQGPQRNFYWIGLVSGLAFLFKATALSGFGLACIACLIVWQQQPHRQGFHTFLHRVFLLGLGFLTSLVPVLLYFASLGLLPRVFMIFTLAGQYVGVARPGLEGPQYLLLYPLAVLAKNNFLALIASLSGLIFILRQQLKNDSNGSTINQKHKTCLVYITIWFALAFVETGTSRTYLQHYYLVFIPPLSLLASWFLQKLYVDIGVHVKQKTAVSIQIVTIVTIFFLSIYQNFPLYYHYLRYAAGWQSYETFLSEGLPGGAGKVALYQQDLADYLYSHTESTDTIYYWSNFMELYYLTNRRSALAFIWPIYAEASGEYPHIFQAKYIVIGNHTIFGLAQTPKWLPAGIRENYVLETTIHEQALYRRIK